LAVTLKKKTLAIITIILFVLSLGATAYIMWQVETVEDVTPEEGEAGLADGWVECDEVMSHNPSEQQCKYYACKDDRILSKDRLKCMDPLSCGDTGCYDDKACTDDNNECDERTDGNVSLQKCILISCPDGYEMSDDGCDCTLIEADPECGDGELNVTGEECELGDPTGISCHWSQCNKTTCKCPTCGDGLLNVTGEECEVNNPTGVSCTWNECMRSSCTCPEEEEEEEAEEEVVVEEDSELPETGIDDISNEMMAFYIAFFTSGGVLVLGYVLESPKKKYENHIVDRFDS
jgi:hypothetical protein